MFGKNSKKYIQILFLFIHFKNQACDPDPDPHLFQNTGFRSRSGSAWNGCGSETLLET